MDLFLHFLPLPLLLAPAWLIVYVLAPWMDRRRQYRAAIERRLPPLRRVHDYDDAQLFPTWPYLPPFP